MSHVFDFLGLTRFVVISYEVLLSDLSGVPDFGCGRPMACSILLMGIISCAFRKAPDVSALAEEDTTLRIVLHKVKIGPLFGGFSKLLLVR